MTQPPVILPGGPPGAGVDAPPPRRPAPVTILAILQLLKAIGYGLIVGVLAAGGSEALDQAIGDIGVDAGMAREAAEVAVLLLVGGLTVSSLAAGILLLRMRQLGWTITMLLAGLGLASSLYLWWAQGTTVAIWAVVEIATVFYLNQRQVRAAFGIDRRGEIHRTEEAGG